MNDLVAWLRAVLDAVESDARSYLELRPDDPDWASLALAEVEAKRRILDDCADYDDVPGVTDGLSVRVPMLLALPYADQPGYREEWRP